ncbi:zinc-ribbon domain-containing protein [Butyrivibrio sp. JL13D10]|uniref:zinc ribbon domain-containing protein n=1 Tax=Butyrivibrio sp. JL13D10 TaxID=3236815 RepID=UPI0038B61CE1
MFCENCGKEIQDWAKFCPYCGKPVRKGHTPQESVGSQPQQYSQGQVYDQPQQYSQGQVYDQAQPYDQGQIYQQTNSLQGANYQYKPQKKNNVGLIIGIIAGVVLLFIAGAAVLLVSLFSTLNKTSGNGDSDAAANAILEQYIDENGDFNPDTNELTSQVADTWTDQSVDMTGKILFATDDGTTKNENSRWEFVDNKKALLVMGDGDYFEADYVVLTGKLGMLYTEFKFPEFGLTFDELSQVTEARMSSDPKCNGYVVIVFDNIVIHHSDGTTEEVNNSTGVLYYGVSYDKGSSTLYDIVGANSANYYNFICDK